MFATDAILATLMCCTRSVNSWDIIVQRVGNKLFFDKRDSSDFGKHVLQMSASFRWMSKAVEALCWPYSDLTQECLDFCLS